MHSHVVSADRPRLWRSRWAAIGAAVAVTFGGGGLFAVSAASPESSVVTLEPVRILDTRDPLNVGLAGPFVSPAPQDLKVTGAVATTTGTKTVVPTGATGVFLNVTPVGSTAAGFISVRPANAAGLPSTSNVNFTVGAINPNAVLVELPVGGADDGKIEITFDAFGAAGPTSDVLVDVVGYTTDAKLKALQAEVDAVEAVNAAQQAQIDAKADAYTKSESDAKYPQGYASNTASALDQSFDPNESRQIQVNCPPGMTAIGGGASNGSETVDPGLLAVEISAPIGPGTTFPSSSPTGWNVWYRNVSGTAIPVPGVPPTDPGGAPVTIRAHVICMAIPGQPGALTAPSATLEREDFQD